MIRLEAKKAHYSRGSAAGQAAIELTVFGAILIFVLGSIVRTAVSNGYAQNENFKAMRMAMLTSWQYSEQAQGKGAPANTSHNTASVLFLEDRLSADVGKYGDLDRNPFIAQGSGTFSYELLYPWEPGADSVTNLIPIEDVWINGVHFPFSTASYIQNRVITRPVCPAGGPYQSNSLTPAECVQNQCLRNAREWVGGGVAESQFETVISVSSLDSNTDATMYKNASKIFQELYLEGVIGNIKGTDDLGSGGPGQTADVALSTPPPQFTTWLESTFPGATQAQVNAVQKILQSNQWGYKLFFTFAVNTPNGANAPAGAPTFSTSAPGSCSGVNNGLCSSLILTDSKTGQPVSNTNADFQYDLRRLGDYSNTTGVESASQFPLSGPNAYLRSTVAWQWAATPGTDAGSIGLDPSSNQYPQYDIDGRLKEVTIYGIGQSLDGSPVVTYEDPDGGDIDGGWDSNSCGPKPGLLNNAQIYTFTKSGTYLQIKEGKLFNPETNQYVQSQIQRNTVDLIQREIQLSNNTGRFCGPTCSDGSLCDNGSCASGSGACSYTSKDPLVTVANDGVTPNPVEVCIPPKSTDTCFTTANIALTCYDENTNIIFVRSRLQDRRGHFWMTNTSGQMRLKS